MTRWEARGRVILAADDQAPLVMGIVNITPDSFSNGGRPLPTEAAVQRAWDLLDQGADLLDLGAESTRPAHSPSHWTRS